VTNYELTYLRTTVRHNAALLRNAEYYTLKGWVLLLVSNGVRGVPAGQSGPAVSAAMYHLRCLSGNSSLFQSEFYECDLVRTVSSFGISLLRKGID